MSRRIVSTKLEAAGTAQQIDTFSDRLIKYIPADIVSAWVAAKGLVESSAISSKQVVLWVCFGVGVVLTALWTLKQTAMPGKKPAVTQTIIVTGAFIVWTIALGEPFSTLLGSTEQALYGSLLLIFYTLLVGLIVPKEG